MSHRWQRDFARAARPPPDIVQGAAETLVSWGLLLMFCIMLGIILIVLGVDPKKG